jgi:hypothetical protein
MSICLREVPEYPIGCLSLEGFAISQQSSLPYPSSLTLSLRSRQIAGCETLAFANPAGARSQIAPGFS